MKVGVHVITERVESYFHSELQKINWISEMSRTMRRNQKFIYCVCCFRNVGIKFMIVLSRQKTKFGKLTWKIHNVTVTEIEAYRVVVQLFCTVNPPSHHYAEYANYKWFRLLSVQISRDECSTGSAISRDRSTKISLKADPAKPRSDDFFE